MTNIAIATRTLVVSSNKSRISYIVIHLTSLLKG